MHIQLADFLKDTNTGKDLQQMIKACVHCGFCNATCPTYSLLGDELDGPRGRIYQIKHFIETGVVTDSVQTHLDRCLTCLSCTTTCPSGVQYNHLIDIGRELVEQRIERSVSQQFIRGALKMVLPYRDRFAFLMSIARVIRPILPRMLKDKVPKQQIAVDVTAAIAERKILLLGGCVQPTLTPRTNQAMVSIFNALGIQTIEPKESGCCGAVSQHLMEPINAQMSMKKNIDAWWPVLEQGAEAIVVTASGCGVMVKDYGWHLRHDDEYKEKAHTISSLCKDPIEIIEKEDLSSLKRITAQTIAFHSPCTLQHGQKLQGRVESLLMRIGFQLTEVEDSHLCCGSAGTYSVLQPEISAQLKQAKLENLQSTSVQLIATANVGCQTHLQSGTQTPVIHWLELLAGFDQQ